LKIAATPEPAASTRYPTRGSATEACMRALQMATRACVHAQGARRESPGVYRGLLRLLRGSVLKVDAEDTTIGAGIAQDLIARKPSSRRKYSSCYASRNVDACTSAGPPRV
jgi:hypothetical protein